ncbi:MAG TPA: LytR C-terminal domain-containing protein [Mycobacterium sp.]|nr:LytR C-terminal domain-containing protein [Mycobacterium sp.]
MSERIPDSAGLPLRAMVMVLLFLGVIFLLVGFQAIGSTGNSADDSDSALTTITATSAPEASKSITETADVRVYSSSEEEGVAERTADQLRDAGWNVTAVDNLSLPDVTETTVYFSDAAGEHQAADAIGEMLHAPVQPRIPDLAEQPPGVVVVMAG